MVSIVIGQESQKTYYREDIFRQGVIGGIFLEITCLKVFMIEAKGMSFCHWIQAACKSNSLGSSQQLTLQKTGKIRKHLGSPPLCSLLHIKVFFLGNSRNSLNLLISRPNIKVFLNYIISNFRAEGILYLFVCSSQSFEHGMCPKPILFC